MSKEKRKSRWLFFGKDKYTYDTIDELVNKSMGLAVGEVVTLNGYYSADDGATHKRVIADTDDGSGVELRSGKWANIVHNGEVNVSWFGAKGDDMFDNTSIFQKAVDYCSFGMKLIIDTHRTLITDEIILNKAIHIKGSKLSYHTYYPEDVGDSYIRQSTNNKGVFKLLGSVDWFSEQAKICPDFHLENLKLIGTGTGIGVYSDKATPNFHRRNFRTTNLIVAKFETGMDLGLQETYINSHYNFVAYRCKVGVIPSGQSQFYSPNIIACDIGVSNTGMGGAVNIYGGTISENNVAQILSEGTCPISVFGTGFEHNSAIGFHYKHNVYNYKVVVPIALVGCKFIDNLKGGVGLKIEITREDVKSLSAENFILINNIGLSKVEAPNIHYVSYIGDYMQLDDYIITKNNINNYIVKNNYNFNYTLNYKAEPTVDYIYIPANCIMRINCIDNLIHNEDFTKKSFGIVLGIKNGNEVVREYSFLATRKGGEYITINNISKEPNYVEIKAGTGDSSFPLGRLSFNYSILKSGEIALALNNSVSITKMKKENVYDDYITYMNDLDNYKNYQQQQEEQKQLAYEEALKENPNLTYEEFMSIQPMLLNIVEEPQPSQALKDFMEKYL